MNHTPLPNVDSAADGFRGARDASLLAAADHDPAAGVCHVQATSMTRPLLRRAGLARVRTHQFYEVPVAWDARFGRLQLSVPNPTPIS